MEDESFQALLKTPMTDIWKNSQLNLIAHKTRDEEIIDKISRNGISDELNKRFLDDRNRKMADKIDHKLHLNQGKFFTAIGAGHVVGKVGVPSLLREKGWTIEKV